MLARTTYCELAEQVKRFSWQIFNNEDIKKKKMTDSDSVQLKLLFVNAETSEIQTLCYDYYILFRFSYDNSTLFL